MNATRRINRIGIVILVLAFSGSAGTLYLIDRSQRGNRDVNVLAKQPDAHETFLVFR